MTNKKFLMGMLAILLSFGMAVVGCGDGGGGSSGKTLTITGITETADFIGVHLLTKNNWLYQDAFGSERLSGSSITIPLIDQRSPIGIDDRMYWEGSGSYILIIDLTTYIGNERNEVSYVWTNGKTFEELGLTDDSDEEIPRYDFSSTNSTIPFSQFQKS
jgi:hypothetical protein